MHLKNISEHAIASRIPHLFLLSHHLNIFSGVGFLPNKVKIPPSIQPSTHPFIQPSTYPSIHLFSTMPLSILFFFFFFCLEFFSQYLYLAKYSSLLNFYSKPLLTLHLSINYKASYIIYILHCSLGVCIYVKSLLLGVRSY